MREGVMSVRKTVALIALFLTLLILPASAAEVYKNEETSFAAVLEDNADLLSEEQEAAIAEEMKPLTAFGNIAVCLINDNPYEDTNDYAAARYEELFDSASGSLFLLDLHYG